MAGPVQGANHFALLHIKRRSEEHTSELQSHHEIVCRLLLEKKKASSRTSRAAEQIRSITASTTSSSRVSSARRHEPARSGLMCAARIWVPRRSIARIGRSATASTGLHCSGRARNRPLGGGHRVSRRCAAERPNYSISGPAATSPYTLSLHDALPI